jgi:hypothetical protein
MKRTLLIGALLLMALLVVSVPAGIGWFIEDRARPALEQRLPGAAIAWDRGWFRSGFAIEDADVDADLDFRHLPLSPPGWLAFDGRVLVTDPATAVDVQGHVSLGMEGEIEASAPTLDHGDRVRWQHGNPHLNLDGRDGRLRVTYRADTLVVEDSLANRLVLANPDGRVVTEESGERKLAVTIALEASRAGLAPSRALLRLDGVDAWALQQMVQAISQLVSEGRDGAVGGLATLGLASAWQQLVEGGLVLTLEQLALDGSLELAGRWSPSSRSFTLAGAGEQDALLAWWSTLAGLIGRLPPEQARAAARRSLADFVDQGLVSRTGTRLRVALESLPADDAR